MNLTDVAHALGTGGGAGAGQGGGFAALVPLLLMFAIFYFLLIRPQQRKQKTEVVRVPRPRWCSPCGLRHWRLRWQHHG